MTRCKATTKRGTRCKNSAGPSGFCYIPAHHPEGELEGAFTPRQQRFIEEYPVDCNGAGAARRAGYSGNPGALATVAHQLLTNCDIRAAIDERLERLSMPAEEALKRLTDWGRASVEPFINGYTEDGEPILDLSTERAQANMHLVKRVKYDANGNLVLELHDQMAAVVHISKAHGLFVDRVEHSGPDGGPIRTSGPDLSGLTDEELEQLDQLLEKAG